MNNPMDLLKAIKNPKEFVLNQMGINNNPVLKKLVEMAENGQEREIEAFAKNFFRENGKNFDEEYKNLMGMLKK